MKVTFTLQHGAVGRVGDGEDVRWHLMALLALVEVHDLLGVDGQALVGVDHHAEQTRVGLETERREKGGRGRLGKKIACK